MGIRRLAQAFLGELDHLIGDIDPVDLPEVLRQRPHQPSGATPDLERRVAPADALQVPDEAFDDVAGSREELLVVLFTAAEGDVVVCVFTGALVPIRAHAVEY